MLGNYKIRVNNEAESKEAQDLFEQLGYEKGCFYTENFPRWVGSEYDDQWYTTGFDISATLLSHQELTLPQLRDMVVLHRNDVKDATHVGNFCGDFYVTCDGAIYSWDEYGAWENDKYNTMSDIKPIQAQPAKQGLISGADALRALADGKEVEYESSSKINYWRNVSETRFEYKEILQEKSNASDVSFRFRLKPRTITLNVEIPAPFEPKEGEECCYITDESTDGYRTIKYSKERWSGLIFGLYRKSDIKQVVAALRGAICKK